MNESNDVAGPALIAYDGSERAQAAIEDAAAQLRRARQAIRPSEYPTARLPGGCRPFLAEVNRDLLGRLRRLARERLP
jgi:hypothetical protein